MLSVIIPSYKRIELTARHVAECLKGTVLPDEIIVVNDGGPKELKGLLPKSLAGIRIVYAYIEEDILWNYNGAVNLGCWLSRGDILAIEDCDHIPGRKTYEIALSLFKERLEIDRLSFGRQIVQVDAMDKPMEEWVQTGSMGTNQMVAMLRRDVYLRLKGQDERMAGFYGWMSYDFPHRRDKLLGCRSLKTNYYWAVLGDQGEPGMVRGLSGHNRKIYRENVGAGKLHSMHGILNFHFSYEVL